MACSVGPFAEGKFRMADVQWEKGYKTAKMDKGKDNYKYLFVTL
jgi:hypothetical protein